MGLQGGQFKSHTNQLSLWQEKQRLHLLKGYIDLLFAKGDIFWKCYGDSIEFNQFVFNWIWFNQTKFNSIQIQSSYIQFKLYYANSFNIKPSSSYLLFSNCVHKIGLQISGRLLIATHLGQSNYLTNHQRSSKLIRLHLIYSTLSGLFQSPRKCLEQSNEHNQIVFIDSTLFLIG